MVGVDVPGFGAPSASSNTNDNSRRSSSAAATNAKTSATTIASTQNKQREYQLDDEPLIGALEPSWLQVAGFKASKKGKTEGDNIIKPGELLQTGTLDASVVGRSKVTLEEKNYHLQLPTRILPATKITKVITSSTACHSLCIDQFGQVYGWGRNDQGQLGSSLPTNVALPTLLEELADTPIVSAAVGKGHSIVLTHEGTLMAVGNNKCGQCGVKSSVETINQFKPCLFAATGGVGSDPKIVQVNLL